MIRQFNRLTRHIPARSFISVVLLLSLISTCFLHAQKTKHEWRPSNEGLFGANVQVFGFNGNEDVFVGTDIGLFRMSAGDERWQPTDVITKVRSISLTPKGTMLVGTEDGTYRSSDGGDTWTKPFTVPGQVNFSYTPVGRIFSAQAGGFGPPSYYYYSDDDGLSWKTQMLLEYGSGNNQFSYTDQGAMLMSVPDGVLISHDLGETWTPTDFKERVYQFVRLSTGETLALTLTGIWSTVDGGAWLLVSDEMISSIAVAPGGDFLMKQSWYSGYKASTDQGIYRSTDAGATRELLLQSGNPTAVAVAPDGTYWVAADRTIYTSSDQGNTWSERIDGISNVAVNMIVSGPDDVLYALAPTGANATWGAKTDYFGLFRSSDLGASWMQVADGLEGDRLWVDSVGNVYTTRREFEWFVQSDTNALRQWNVLQQSGDRGATWTDLAENIIPTRVMSNSSGVVAFGSFQLSGSEVTNGDLHVSRDSGRTWTRLSMTSEEWNASDYPKAVRDLIVLPDGRVLFTASVQEYSGRFQTGMFRTDVEGTEVIELADTLLLRALSRTASGTLLATGSIAPSGDVSTHTFGSFRSTDDGTTWQQTLGSATPSTPVSHFIAVTDNSIVAYGSNAYRSSDGGQTWEEMTYDERSMYITNLTRHPSGSYFAVFLSKIFVSANRGASWLELNDGLPPAQPTVVTAARSTDRVFVGTFEHGIYRSEVVADTTNSVSSRTDSDVTELSLIKAEDDNAAVRFTLSEGSTVSIELYDVLGNRVAALSQQRTERGRHTVTFPLSGIASGNYLLLLRTERGIRSVPVPIR